MMPSTWFEKIAYSFIVVSWLVVIPALVVIKITRPDIFGPYREAKASRVLVCRCDADCSNNRSAPQSEDKAKDEESR